MNRLSAIGLILLISSAVPSAEARVFNFKDSKLAAYLRGHWGLSSVNKDAFTHSSGDNTTVDDQSNFQYGGELGLQMGLGSTLSMRLGAEIIQHSPVSGALGLSPSDSERFQLDSSVFIFNPSLTFEYVYSMGPSTRYYAALGLGYADVTVENRYTMSALGTTDLGVASFNEKMSAQSTSVALMTGLETLFVDNTTVSIDIAYRYLPIQSMKYKSSVNNIVTPTGVAKGSTVLNADGSDRTMDLSGVYLGLTFRFYLNFM